MNVPTSSTWLLPKLLGRRWPCTDASVSPIGLELLRSRSHAALQGYEISASALPPKQRELPSLAQLGDECSRSSSSRAMTKPRSSSAASLQRSAIRLYRRSTGAFAGYRPCSAWREPTGELVQLRVGWIASVVLALHKDQRGRVVVSDPPKEPTLRNVAVGDVDPLPASMDRVLHLRVREIGIEERTQAASRRLGGRHQHVFPATTATTSASNCSRSGIAPTPSTKKSSCVSGGLTLLRFASR